MKRKKINWDHVPWTSFDVGTVPDGKAAFLKPGEYILVNSRYQVNVTPFECEWGRGVELSIKTRDKQARHDWRDLQRIKNEIVGPEWEAIELYPAESRLVDSANQYFLFAFPPPWRAPVGFPNRLVMAQSHAGAVQRPWPKGETPPDVLSPEQFDALLVAALAKRAAPETP